MAHNSHDGQLLAHVDGAGGDGLQDLAYDDVANRHVGLEEVNYEVGGKNGY